MKTLRLFLAAGSFVLTTATSQAVITTYAVDFNGGDTSYTENFRTANDAPAAGFTWESNVGVGGGGGLTVTNTGQNNLFYRPTPVADATSNFNFAGLSAGQGFSTSADFMWSNKTATELTVINLGFSNSNTAVGAFSQAGSMGGSIIRSGSSTVTLRLRTGSTTPFSLTFNQSALSTTSWYRLSFDAVKSSTADTFNTMVTLYSIGADGLGAPVIFFDGTKNITIAGEMTAAELYSDSGAFGLYDIRNTNGIDVVDNLNVSFVPEPGSCGLLALGTLGLVAGRRRR